MNIAVSPVSRDAQKPVKVEAIDSMPVDLGIVMATLTSPDGLEIRDRFHHLHLYRACFLGSGLIDFLAQRFSLSRSQALRLGQRLEAFDHVRHVSGEHSLKDEPLFYCIGPGPTVQSTVESILDPRALAELVQEMLGTEGVLPGSRYRLLVCYPLCFSGREVVNWIATHCCVTRALASQIGTSMLQANFIRHLFDEHGFEDSRRLYRFV